MQTDNDNFSKTVCDELVGMKNHIKNLKSRLHFYHKTNNKTTVILIT